MVSETRVRFSLHSRTSIQLFSRGKEIWAKDINTKIANHILNSRGYKPFDWNAKSGNWEDPFGISSGNRFFTTPRECIAKTAFN